MLACPSETTSEHRDNQIAQLQESIINLGTPWRLTEAIIHGITKWTMIQLNPSTTQRAPTIGSLNPSDIAITQAYHEQTQTLGWDNLLRGRISKLWGRAYKLSNQISNTQNSSGWTKQLIHLLWKYTLSLWECRNSILHGKNVEEAEMREKEALKQQISEAYEDYAKDPFSIPSHLRSLFTARSLNQRLKQDMDSLKCWLRSVYEAKATQQASDQRYAEASKAFFQPRPKKPLTSNQKQPQKETIHSSPTSVSSIHSQNSSQTILTTISQSQGSESSSTSSIPTSISICSMES
jgi:hypothetical protein